MVNDTISDMLTKIRNANNAKHQLVNVPSTKLTNSIIQILKEEGFVEDYKIIKDGIKTNILIALRYTDKEKKPVISHLERISKPGIRIYSGKKNIPNVLGKLGISIISTSQGVMTNKKAKELKIGGEILCKIY
jgi:small subunit ribosomal protein S8